MLQIQRFSLSAKEPLMACHKRSGDPDFDVVGIGFQRGVLSGVPAGNGIGIGFKQHRRISADSGIGPLGDIRSVMRQHLQALPILLQHNTYWSRPAVYLVIQIVNAFLQQLSIQLLQVLYLGKWYTYIAPDIPHKVLHQSFFISGCWIAENRLEAVMG